jgi:hypothetical protein
MRLKLETPGALMREPREKHETLRVGIFVRKKQLELFFFDQTKPNSSMIASIRSTSAAKASFI